MRGMNVLVTGAGGYVGSVLVKKLLQRGYFVRALDLFMYDREPFREIPFHLHKRLEILKGDIRKHGICEFATDDIDCIIHLGCISNDPGCDLNPELARSINLDSFKPFVMTAKRNGVSRFINASSSSVYGVSNEPNITEESKTEPLTDYSRFKLETENILLEFEGPHFTTTSIRSATVCGYSPRQRLDVIVNILTSHAYNKSEINVFGGPQKRPNVHIDDITNLYTRLVEWPAKDITGEVFNFGGPNYTVDEIADMVKDYFNRRNRKIKIRHQETNDPRSYHISSDKIRHKLGLAPQKTITDAIGDLVNAFDNKLIPNYTDSKYYNVRKLKELNLK